MEHTRHDFGISLICIHQYYELRHFKIFWSRYKRVDEKNVKVREYMKSIEINPPDQNI